MKTRKQIISFIVACMSLSLKHGKCLQGCGNRLKRGQVNFCSDVCRHLYDIRTWGEGRLMMDLAQPLKQSLKIATNSPNAVLAFRKVRKHQEVEQ